MARGVYRRPQRIRRRRFVPHTFAASAVVVVRRRRPHVARAHVHRVRRVVLPFGAQAQVWTVLVLRRTRVLRRAFQRARARPQVFGTPQAAGVSRTIVRRRRVAQRPRLRPAARRPIPGSPAAPVVPGKAFVLARVLKAVSRFRRAAQIRLRFTPIRPVLPTKEIVFGSNKALIAGPEMARGLVSEG